MSSAVSSFDVVIVGAGPAGLSAALILGRCRRKVLICDRGTPRSWASKAMHGFLTRDGIPPAEFAALARAELGRYPSVHFEAHEVRQARPVAAGFEVIVGERTVQARKLLIATGLADELPAIEGLDALFGTSVFQCPYCDGWEVRDQPVAAYGKRGRGLQMARALTAWTRDVVLCTDGPCGYSPADLQHLERNGIRLLQQRIQRLEGTDGMLQNIVFRDGTVLPRSALFFDTPSHGQSDLTAQLGCRFNRNGGVLCGQYEATSVAGVYVAGNIIRNVQLSIVAAAEGANAAFGINRALTREDFEGRATGARVVEHTGPAS
ncbi:MAG: NAD(P)/FAD-dependent oxidoreductase [Steroidobacteraceae bacterium]